MWCYRKLLKIRWVDKVTNAELLNLVKEKSLYASIKRRRDRSIGSTLRHERLSGKILERIVLGWQQSHSIFSMIFKASSLIQITNINQLCIDHFVR